MYPYICVLSECDVDNKDTRRRLILCIYSGTVSVMWSKDTKEIIDHYVSLQPVLSECDVDNKDTRGDTMCPYIHSRCDVKDTVSLQLWTTKDTKEIIDHYVSLQLYCQSVMWTKTQEEIIDHYVSLQLYCQTVLSECDVDLKDTRRELFTMCPTAEDTVKCDVDNKDTREIIDHYVSLQLYCPECDVDNKDTEERNCSLCVPTAVLSECDVDNKDTGRIDHYVSLQQYCQCDVTTKTQEQN
ncbi:unnamed protein product [Mytilus edulis]|uniref:Uncharacterized protein n=1 Tax=Mytilus edulis TaxID=6550 RepID=A0A8S3RPI1_MYTED|nr:unnamed protein product [Mytilus edulis]